MTIVVALAACDKARELRDYADKAKVSEAKVQLSLIAKRAKAYAVEHATFPGGDAGPAPATPCCSQPRQRCDGSETDWSAAPWSALDFRIDEPIRFQYSYHGGGDRFTATAVGDPSCDGHPVTLTVRGTIVAGEPRVDLDAP